MSKSSHLLTTTALALLVASCGSSSDSAPAPTAAASESAMIETSPFGVAETAMKEKMEAAIGASISDTWLAQMIEHHAGAIAMSKIVLSQNPSSDVRRMAEDTIAMQGKEIVELTKLRSQGATDPASIEPYLAAGMAMDRSMMAATGSDISETYLRKMLEHHRGAIALSDIVIAQGSDPKVRAAAQKTRAVQAKEVAMIEAMLAGKPMEITNPPASAGKPRAAASKSAAVPSSAPGASDMKDMPGMKM